MNSHKCLSSTDFFPLHNHIIARSNSNYQDINLNEVWRTKKVILKYKKNALLSELVFKHEYTCIVCVLCFCVRKGVEGGGRRKEEEILYVYMWYFSNCEIVCFHILPLTFEVVSTAPPFPSSRTSTEPLLIPLLPKCLLVLSKWFPPFCWNVGLPIGLGECLKASGLWAGLGEDL